VVEDLTETRVVEDLTETRVVEVLTQAEVKVRRDGGVEPMEGDGISMRVVQGNRLKISLLIFKHAFIRYTPLMRSL